MHHRKAIYVADAANALTVVSQVGSAEVSSSLQQEQRSGVALVPSLGVSERSRQRRCERHEIGICMYQLTAHNESDKDFRGFETFTLCDDPQYT